MRKPKDRLSERPESALWSAGDRVIASARPQRGAGRTRRRHRDIASDAGHARMGECRPHCDTIGPARGGSWERIVMAIFDEILYISRAGRGSCSPLRPSKERSRKRRALRHAAQRHIAKAGHRCAAWAGIARRQNRTVALRRQQKGRST